MATPVIKEPQLRLDLGIRVAWKPQVEVLFEICIVETLIPITLLSRAHQKLS